MLTYASVCSGIEAASVAWGPLGWTPAFLAEIDSFPCAVLAHRFPEVPNLGDFTKIEGSSRPIDVLVGGTPCQSFSVAGLRGGMDDPRGDLALEFLRLARRLRPDWLVWENVPGVLSSNGGRDFGAFLGGLAELRYGWAYRVLDAQFFGVPQRRRRVFVVAHSGGLWQRAAAVLFERSCLSGHPPESREEEPCLAPSVTPGARRASANRSGELLTVAPPLTSRPWSDRDCQHDRLVADTLKGHHGRGREDDTYIPDIAHSLRADGFDASEDGTGRGTPLIPVTAPTLFASDGGPSNGYAPVIPVAYQCHGSNVGPMGTVRSGNGNTAGGVPFIVNAAENCARQSHAREASVARCLDSTGSFASAQGGTVVAAPIPIDMRQASRGGRMTNNRREGSSGGAPGTGVGEPGDPAPSLSLSHPPAIGLGGVRRLTPLECERLMGFPDSYTLVPYRGKPATDGPRYKALGNSFAVPVMAWIGRRIAMATEAAR